MTAPRATPIDLAERALDRATSEPRSGPLAKEALAAAEAAGDVAAQSIAWRALGLLAREAGDLRTSVEHFRVAITVAESAGLPVLAAEARMSLAPALAMAGDGKAALEECERAASALSGLRRARLDAQAAAMLHHEGRTTEALAAFARAIPVLRRHGDKLSEARARHNRGLVLFDLGDLAKARTDLLASERGFRDTGALPALAATYHHLGMVDAGRGDLPAALAWFDQADGLANRLGVVDPRGLMDRCTALLPARLGEEARAAADGAVRELTRTGNEQYLAVALLAQAEAHLLLLDHAAAATAALKAEHLLRRQRRSRLAALASAAAVRARWQAGERSAALLADARKSASSLEREGCVDPAIDVEVLGAELALARSRRAAARRFLSAALAHRKPASTVGRVRRQQAVALMRLMADDVTGADTALRAGLRALDRHRGTLGATELRARAAGHGQELARLGVGLAVRDGDVRRAFAWAERWHAASLQLPPTRAPQNAEMARQLADLRRVTVDLEAAVAGSGNGRVAALQRRQADLEAAINRRLRATPGANESRSLPSLPAVRATLDDQVLLELVTDGDDLWGVVLGDRRPPALVRLGSYAAVKREVDSVRFGLRRLAAGGRSHASVDAALRSVAAAGAALDQVLVEPIRDRLGDRGLVVVPTGATHALPWAVVPSFSGRAVTVAPSAAAWLRARTQAQTHVRRASAHRRPVVLVAGPRLAGAAREVRRLGKEYPSATALAGTRATAPAVMSALDGAPLAHVAAHGTFRADNPLFSALELADGPLTVHDLEGLQRPPEVLVLPACDSGLSAVHPGDELIGLVASLLALGTRTIVASLLPVPDDTTLDVMVAFHARLREGASVAAALAGAQQAVAAGGDPRGLAAAASLVCFGGG